MSRIGKKPVQVVKGVAVTVDGQTVKVKGPKGELAEQVAPLTSVAVDGGAVKIARADDSRIARANHGLMRALVQNMVIGVTQGFEKRLEIMGVGFKAEMKGRTLVLNLGFSHPVEFEVPQGIDIAVDKQTALIIKGTSKQRVSQVAAVIRQFRKPDHYKGKGVRYLGENVRIKAGKSA